jgi:hypothetical protein
MKPEDVDRVLSEEADIVPSSGFVAAVMEAVTAEATAPPLTFPWKRAVPLVAAFPALLLWLAFMLTGPEVTTPGPGPVDWFETIVPMATGWVAAGLVMTAAITAWSLWLVRLR